MIRFYRSPQITEVIHIQHILEAEGIAVVVQNLNTNMVTPELMHGGGDLGAWPEIWLVHPEDREDALKILHAIQEQAKTPPEAWECPKCSEALEGQFDSCWKCGAERTIPETTF